MWGVWTSWSRLGCCLRTFPALGLWNWMQGILIWTILLRLLYWPCQAWWEKQMDGGVVLWIKTASVSRISSRMSGDTFFLQYMKVSVLQLTFNHPSGCQSFSLSTVSWWVMAPGHLVKPVLKKIVSHHRLQPEDDGCISSCKFHSAAFIFYWNWEESIEILISTCGVWLNTQLK